MRKANSEMDHQVETRCCRLCAEDQEVTIMLFGEEAESMHLQHKLNKYLLIEVDEDDKLPKQICLICCNKLQLVCDFVDNVHRAYQILQSKSISLELAEINNKPNGEDNTYMDFDANVTRMEVSIDPQTVLENSSDSEHSIDESIEEEDMSHLLGARTDDVTIKLIKRKDKNSTSDDKDEEDSGTSDVKPFQCHLCSRGYITELALKNHLWSQHTHDGKEFTCHICKKTYKDRRKLADHLRQHKINSTCNICKRIFRYESNLILHMKKHDSSASFECDICGRTYDKFSNLKTHTICHSKERPFECEICGKTFKRNQDLKFHRNLHTGARPYKCPFCEKCFASSGNCYSHRSRMHPGRRAEPIKKVKETVRIRDPSDPDKTLKWMCTLCKRTFSKKDNYTYHMFQHTGQKPYKCTYCSEKFITRKGLMVHHDQTHPFSERPYHMFQHTGQKPYKCTYCSEKFITRKGLMVHHDQTHPFSERPLSLLTKNVLLR